MILTDGLRLTQSTGLGTKLTDLSLRTGGVVVDVNTSPRIHALNVQADTFKACPYAKNLVAEAIREVVNSYRDANATLKYVVIAGGDSVIPFFRYADSAGIGPESDFVPPADTASASEASLRRNYVLGQDAYGSESDLSLKGAVLPVPDLAVGRLVETPTQIIGMIDAYLGLTNGVLPTATSSLVTGYDFLTSAADSVQADFAASLGPNGRADTLITNQGVPTTTTTVGTPTRSTGRGPPRISRPRCSVRVTISSSWRVTSAPTTRWPLTTRPACRRLTSMPDPTCSPTRWSSAPDATPATTSSTAMEYKG